jgi:hypothetical protein
LSVQKFEDIHNMLNNIIIIRLVRLPGVFGEDKFLQGT